MTGNAARKISMFVYALLILPLPLALYASNQWTAALIIGLALFAHQGFSTNIFGMTSDIVPSKQVGRVIAMGALAGNLTGAAMLEFTGWALDGGLGELFQMDRIDPGAVCALVIGLGIIPDMQDAGRGNFQLRQHICKHANGFRAANLRGTEHLINQP